MIKTGKLIYDLLKADAALGALVGSHIYAVVAPEGTPRPLIVYAHSFQNEHTKDGRASSTSDIEVIIVADSYSEVVNAAEAVDKCLKPLARLQSGEDSFEEFAFRMTLHYTVNTRG